MRRGCTASSTRTTSATGAPAALLRRAPLARSLLRRAGRGTPCHARQPTRWLRSACCACAGPHLLACLRLQHVPSCGQPLSTPAARHPLRAPPSWQAQAVLRPPPAPHLQGGALPARARAVPEEEAGAGGGQGCAVRARMWVGGCGCIGWRRGRARRAGCCSRAAGVAAAATAGIGTPLACLVARPALEHRSHPCPPPPRCRARRHLHIPLVQAERAWAYAMDLKSQLEEGVVAQVGCGLASEGQEHGVPAADAQAAGTAATSSPADRPPSAAAARLPAAEAAAPDPAPGQGGAARWGAGVALRRALRRAQPAGGGGVRALAGRQPAAGEGERLGGRRRALSARQVRA